MREPPPLRAKGGAPDAVIYALAATHIRRRDRGTALTPGTACRAPTKTNREGLVSDRRMFLGRGSVFDLVVRGDFEERRVGLRAVDFREARGALAYD